MAQNLKLPIQATDNSVTITKNKAIFLKLFIQTLI